MPTVYRNILAESLAGAEAYMREKMQGRNPKIGLVLGSGLNPMGENIEDPIYIPYNDVPMMKVSTAEGHVGRFIIGRLDGVEIMAMQGRLHAYEGNTSEEVAFPVWLMARLGMEIFITTNAAGAINETYHVGDFCFMKDHINFTGRNPVASPDATALGGRFFSMTDAYDPELRAIGKRVAAERGVRVQEGVYLGLLGPSFESPAEIRAFRAWGADTVAMSVCEEVIAARQMGVRVMGISLCSNMAAGVGSTDGVGGADPNGAEVMEAAAKAARDFEALIRGIVAEL